MSDGRAAADSCPECGYSAADWERPDAVRLLDEADALLDEVLSGGEAIGPGGEPDSYARLRWEMEQLPAEAAALDGARLLEATHRMTHLLSAAGRARWAGQPPQAGVVRSVQVSDGGVPKTAVQAAEVGRRGLIGDRQASREHHGSPYQALCLWSAEVIAALAAEGHPIGPGSAGENLTLGGLNWAAVHPGMRLAAGPVLAEITCYATPCRKNARWFTGGDYRRMSQHEHPGWSRLYARVLAGGRVAAGDPVTVEPGG